MSKPIIGWDLCRGSGAAAEELEPGKRLGQIPLFRVVQSPGELPGIPDAGKLYQVPLTATQIAVVRSIDILNLDPRLTIVATFFHQAMANRPDSTGLISSIMGMVTPKMLAVSNNPSEPDRELYTMETADLFGNSGYVGTGCEIVSGAQGIRLTVAPLQMALLVQHDIMATLVALPNISFGCPELARAVISRLQVRIPDPFAFYAYCTP